MTRIILAALLALGLSGPAADAQDGAEGAIRDTIGAQIEAFRADDFETAFGFASPGIKGMFGSPERFGAMVRQGYPMVWRPDEVRYLDLREVAGRLWQRVMITDADGAIHLLDYQMVQTENGWQINGVQILRDEAPAV